MTDTLIKKLEQFGLTQKESAVYTAALIGGEMTAEEIAKQAKQNRSTAYVQLRSLTEAGLITTFKRGKKTFFAAESPQNLERIIHKKSEEIERQKAEVLLLVPELLRVYGTAGDRPVVRIFEGKEGLISMRNDILSQKPKDLKVITAFSRMQKIFTDEELMKFTRKRETLKIKSYVLYENENGKIHKPFKYQEMKIFNKKKLPFSSDIYIYEDSVSYASIEGAIVGVTITNKAIATSMRSLFDSCWQGSE